MAGWNEKLRRDAGLKKPMLDPHKPLFWQKWTPDVFFLFPAAMYTNLYKFVWNIMSNNSSMEYRTDLRLGQSTYLFIVYSVYISWLHSLNGFRFLFWWRDSENRQYLFACVKRNKMDSELLLKFIEYFPDYLLALSCMLVGFSWTTFVETAVYILEVLLRPFWL